MSNIIVMTRKYSDDNALDDVLNYCYRNCIYWHGYGVRIGTLEDAKESMLYIKKYHNQTDGRRLAHMVVNVDTSRSTGHFNKYSDMEALYTVAFVLSYLIFKEGYQNCYFIHDGKNCPHAHFVINSVDCKSGNKLRDTMDLAYWMLEFLKDRYPKLAWERVYYNKVENDKYGY